MVIRASCSSTLRGMSIFLPRRNEHSRRSITRSWSLAPTMASRDTPRRCGACSTATTSPRSSSSTRWIWRTPGVRRSLPSYNVVWARAVWMPRSFCRKALRKRTPPRLTRGLSKNIWARGRSHCRRFAVWCAGVPSSRAFTDRPSRTRAWPSCWMVWASLSRSASGLAIFPRACTE